MYIAQFSDLHYGPRTLEEVDRCFGHAVERAIEARVDAAVISGDSTDHELDLHSPAVERLARRVRQLTEHCPVLMLQGTYSHERPGTLSIFRLLGGTHLVYVADRIRQVALTEAGAWVESGGWRFEAIPAGTRALFSCLPSVNKADVAAAVGALGAAEAVGEAIADLLAGWGETNRRARATNVPTVGVSHGTVLGCVTEHGVPMAGLDHEFTTTALFGAEVSAFMLGHIHKHQAWREGERLVAYAGSIGRLHYGEEDDKGFLLWSVGPEGARFEFVETPARRMVHLEFEGKPDLEAVKTAAETAQGAFVRVRWSVPEEEQGSVDRGAIEAALQGAAGIKLEGRVMPVVRSRAEGISQAATLAEKLRRWAEAAGVDAAGLLERLARMEASDVEEIVQAIAAGEGGEEAAGDGEPLPVVDACIGSAAVEAARAELEPVEAAPAERLA
jgi:DNA repair protein SbcD/Mre11